MTERSLLLRSAVADHYVALATDFPAARVFDTNTSALVAVVELAAHSRVSLSALSLTSVALSMVSAPRKTTSSTRAPAHADSELADCYAAVGLSNGTVLVHNVTKDELVDQVVVSETQHAIVSMATCGSYLFSLAANSMLYAVDMTNARNGVALRTRTPPDASALAVVAVEDDDANSESGAVGHGSSDENRKAPHSRAFRVVVGGTTTAVYMVRTAFSPSSSTSSAHAQSRSQCTAERVLSFASQGTAVDFAWLSARRGHTGCAAVTASAQEGVVRVWDIDAAVASAANGGAAGRCRRTLLCGQRIGHLSVVESASDALVAVTTLTGAVLLWDLSDTGLLPRTVEAAPLVPSVALLSSAAVGRLLLAHLQPVRTTGATRTSSADRLHNVSLLLLRGRFALPRFDAVNVGAAIRAMAGKEAADSNEGTAALRKAVALASLAFPVGASSPTALVDLPLSTAFKEELERLQQSSDAIERSAAAGGGGKGMSAAGDGAANAFHVMDTVWATNQQRIAARAAITPTEAFVAPHAYHAPSTKELPVKQLTLEQRLRQVALNSASNTLHKQAMVAAAAAENSGAVRAEEELDGGNNEDDANTSSALASVLHLREARYHNALGLATVPLYQALHAGDTSAVMELLSIAARSPAGMRATVLSLQLPYCLQLMSVLSERLGICSAKTTKGVAVNSARAVVGGGLVAVSTRSPLLEWMDVIIHFRGMELYAAQREASALTASKQALAAGQTSKVPTAASSSASAAAAHANETEEGMVDPPQEDVLPSPPKDFIAPVLHQYRNMCNQYDKLATLYGRMSIFNAVRPSERGLFVNTTRKVMSSNLEAVRLPASRTRKLDTAVLQDDIIFPAMFSEVRARRGPYAVRVRSRAMSEKQRRRRASSDRAVLRRAKQLAKAQLAKKGANGASDDAMDDMMEQMMKGADGEMDLDALDAMDLGDGDGGDGSGSVHLSESGSSAASDEEDDDEGSESDGSSDGSMEDEDEEEEDDDDSGPTQSKKKGKKLARLEQQQQQSKRSTVAHTKASMLADVGSQSDEEDEDAQLDSSEAEFSSASDDEVRSEVLDLGDSSDEESTSSSGDDSDAESVNSAVEDALEAARDARDRGGDDSADEDPEAPGGHGDGDDGMAEAMQDLLEAHQDERDKTEKRRSKRLRLD